MLTAIFTNTLYPFCIFHFPKYLCIPETHHSVHSIFTNILYPFCFFNFPKHPCIPETLHSEHLVKLYWTYFLLFRSILKLEGLIDCQSSPILSCSYTSCNVTLQCLPSKVESCFPTFLICLACDLLWPTECGSHIVVSVLHASTCSLGTLPWAWKQAQAMEDGRPHGAYPRLVSFQPPCYLTTVSPADIAQA